MPGSSEWDSVKELFLAVLDAEPSQRSNYLNEASLPADVRRAVGQLLEAHDKAGSFLGMPAAAYFELEASSFEPCFEEGSILAGRFQIVRYIARGGMGEVYEALDTELQSMVAIKTIRKEIAGTPQALAQFKREVLLARQVTHPNACRIFDIFRDSPSSDPSAAVLFVSMELLHGETIAERLKRTGRLPADEVQRLMVQVAQALAAAHDAGILHRDLKPANIMLEAQSDGALRAVIMDFGLAWTPTRTDDSLSSANGKLSFGTPEYMSPEQIEGRPLTPASDIYSLGLVTYQMLTGARAFCEDRPLLSALRRLKELPPPPSKLVPHLDRDWDYVLSRCLSPDPEERFSRACELLEALERLDDGTPSIQLRIRCGLRTLRQNLLARSLTFACILATLSCGAILFLPLRAYRWNRRHSSGIVSAVLADFVNTTGDPVFDKTLNTALSAKLQQSPYLDLLPQSRVQRALRYMGSPANQRLTSLIAQQVCQREGGEIVLQGEIATTSSGYFLTLNAIDCQTRKFIVRESGKAASRNDVLGTLDRLSNTMRSRLGESSESIRKYSVPIEDASTSSFDALAAYSKGLQVTREKGEYAAVPYYREAVKLDPNFALAYAQLSAIEWNRGDLLHARVAATQAYKLLDRVTQWERFNILSNYYAIVTGQLDKEIQTYQAWSKVYPHDDQWPLDLAVVDSLLGKYGDSSDMLRLAIRNNPDLSVAYGDLSLDYLIRDRPDEARAVLEEAKAAHLYEINMDWVRYWIAFYNHEPAKMSEICSQDAASPGLAVTLMVQQARTAAYDGQLRASHAYALEVAHNAQGPDKVEFAATREAEEGLWEAEFGKTRSAQQDIAEALKTAGDRQSTDVEIVTALARSTLGKERQAEVTVNKIRKQSPLNTLVKQYWVPVIEARVALRHNQPERALDILRATTPYELGIFNPLPCMYSVYERGQAHLALHEGALAARDFRELLAHRGIVLNCPTGALAELGLARSLALSGNTSASRAAYQDLFAIWSNGDKDLRPLKEAKAEYQKL
jgi:serine/threonine protein kinase/tetratricopeptide (TPR) repeat protein